MAWLKDAYLDLMVLLLIVVYAVYLNNILEVVLWVYTSLLLFSKILAFFMPSLQQKANKTSAPALFYHIIYALTVAIFIYISDFYLAGVWCVIWIVSIFGSPRTNKKKH